MNLHPELVFIYISVKHINLWISSIVSFDFNKSVIYKSNVSSSLKSYNINKFLVNDFHKIHSIQNWKLDIFYSVNISSNFLFSF